MTTTRTASTASPPVHAGGLLHRALRLDAVVSGLNGALFLGAAPLLDGPLGLSTGLLRGLGAFMLVYAATVWLVGERRPISTTGARTVAGANVAWVVASVVVALTGTFTPTTLGTVVIVLQALVVAGFAALQLLGLRHR